MKQGEKRLAHIEVAGQWPKEFGKIKAVQVAEEALSLVNEGRPVSFGLSVVSEEKIRRLGHDYRGQDKVTDVLSFRLGEDESFPEQTESNIEELGDIMICLAQVRRQAQDIGRPLATEMALMVAHGTLHLLGYDHCELKDEEKMFSLQQEVLMRLNYL